MPLESVGSPALWAGFVAFVLAMLALDLGVFHRKAHAVSLREAAAWSAVWIALAAAFNVGLYFWAGPTRALEFTAGYLVEKALSVDNVFVFAVIFAYFRVPASCQHRVLFWGILGALATRAAFIVAGGAFLQRFHWAIYVFGALLAATGVKLLVHRGAQPHPERNPIVRLFTRFMPVVPRFSDGRIRRDRERPALRDAAPRRARHGRGDGHRLRDRLRPRGLRGDVGSLRGVHVERLRDPRPPSALLPARRRHGPLPLPRRGSRRDPLFVGAKMMLTDVYEVPVGAALAIVAGILATSIGASMLPSRRPPPGSFPGERRGARRRFRRLIEMPMPL